MTTPTPTTEQQRGRLPPYLKHRPCPKCAQTDVLTRFVSAGDAGGYGSPGWDSFAIREQDRLDRHCRNCHYEWSEAPRDMKAKP